MQSIKEIYKIGYGPSSSHTIAPGRAATIFSSKNPDAKRFKVTLYGSLAATGIGHHTDKAILKELMPKEVQFVWKPDVFLETHSNGMEITAYDADGNEMDTWEVFSVGGGDLLDANGRLFENNVYPHQYLAEIMEYCKAEGKTFWEYVEDHEGPEIWEYLKGIWEVMKDSVRRGIDNEGILPGPIKLQRKASGQFMKASNSSGTIKSMGLLFSFALAVSEENAAGAKVVTGPTCGAAGVLPGVLFYLNRDENLSEQKILRGLATAALVGNIVKHNASISGAEVGCQGEIGTACAMASAAMAQIMGGTINQIEYAAEMGFEHNLGLTCDPVLGYVQIPCIERNAIAAGKAYECASYALFSDGGHKIPFDQVVKTMAETGNDIQVAYRETGIGGLAKSWEEFI
ncbi:L-serine ammonia-lyase [Alistipes sp. ZOR0009]|jgi:L-serine dehydratase|uniref:L-serine ammonia-lyase n=1 Tax=Alistipes sp. ZOR0009 TaxID=1339253 RepID=UPI000648F4A2|nr:L-serine ammonia-lyase [Alistipes sp. ZOR0009]